MPEKHTLHELSRYTPSLTVRVATMQRATHTVIAHSNGAPASLYAMSRVLRMNQPILITPPSSLLRTSDQFSQHLGLRKMAHG
ncbi:hypothetical protein [Chitinivorax sp. B]|uniref:hypothetical protein n=1 Tax=Chitinivorax sp. B TaxID=2502235 RepID=UPI0010F9506D|nr:hypothetical protein [Chitinivorax sp. B]